MWQTLCSVVARPICPLLLVGRGSQRLTAEMEYYERLARFPAAVPVQQSLGCLMGAIADSVLKLASLSDSVEQDRTLSCHPGHLCDAHTVQ